MSFGILIASNNAITTLASPISPSSTSITLTGGSGALFPNPSAGHYFTLTLNDAATGLLYEICACTARSGDVCTVVRAQEGTTALSWQAGDRLGNFWTAQSAATYVQQAQLQVQANNYAIDTGTTNALVATLALAPASLAAITGSPIRIKVAHTVTGVTTLNLNGFGVTPVIFTDTTTMDSGYLVAGGIYEFIYDGTNFQVNSYVTDDILATGLSTTLTTAENFAAFVGTRTQIITAAGSGSFTFPSGVQAAQFFLTGGGAGGMGCQSATWVSGAGGGAGATEMLGLSLGGVLTVNYVIGAGGAGGVGALAGAAGNASTVTVNSVVYTAAGGGANVASLAGSNYFLGGGPGGVATVGQGVNGGSGSDSVAAAFIFLGTGGSSYWGGSGKADAGKAGHTQTNASTVPGCGGSGIYDPSATNTAFTGGNGAPGCLIINY